MVTETPLLVLPTVPSGSWRRRESQSGGKYFLPLVAFGWWGYLLLSVISGLPDILRDISV